MFPCAFLLPPSIRSVLPGVIVVLCLLAMGILANAEEPTARTVTAGQRITPKGTTGKPVSRPVSPAAGGGWWSTIGSLAIVLAAIVGLAGLLRMQLPAARGLLPRDVLYDLGRRPLDGRTVIHLLRCGSRILVIGSSSQGLSTLAEITDPIEVDHLTGLCKPQSPADAPKFQETLRRFFGMSPRDAAAAESPEELVPEDTASQRLKDRLRQTLTSAAPAEALHG